MATGNTLCVFTASGAEYPSSNFGRIGSRNQRRMLKFDTTTQQTVFFTGVLPRIYGGGGITVYIHWSATTATTGTVGWDVSFERIGSGQQDTDADGFATAQTITATTVPGTSGNVAITSVAVTDGANIDSIAVGESFRLRVRRDVANDNAAGDAELWLVELKET